MQTYKKLLVVLDPEDRENLPLHRAAYFARQSGAHITVLLVVYDLALELFSSLSNKHGNKLKENVIRERRQWLKQQLDSVELNGLVVNTKVCWHKHQHLAIAEQISRFHYDLVVKGASLHSELGSLLITPIDWHLLRECLCPVLLVQSAQWHTGGRIVSAIDLDNHQGSHQAFNNKILQETCYLAELLNAEVHLVNCYLGEDVNMYIAPPSADRKVEPGKVKHQHASMINLIAQQYQISQDNVHILEGHPDHAIPRVVRDIDAELVILGTRGRSGISEALMGHTAEYIIDQVNCDLLALKPDNIQFPQAGLH